MTKHTGAAVIMAVALSTALPHPAFAQAPATIAPSHVAIQPDAPRRWDIAGQVAWLGANKSGLGSWDNWYGAAAGGVSGGYYWTPHLKLDLDLSSSTRGHIYGRQESLTVPGIPVPVFRTREHYFQSSALGAGLHYQFFDNAWFHPFVGAGVAVERETRRSVNSRDIFYPPSDPRAPVIAALPEERAVTYTVRPAISAGFKWYVSERAFIRSDVRALLSSNGVEQLAWRGGVGVDF